MVVESAIAEWAFLIGRVLYGGILAFTGLGHFMDLESMAGYARSKGVPLARTAVLATGLLLILGGVSIALGAYATLGSLKLVLFFLVVTPMMHDFWNMEDPGQYQQEQVNFLKNLALLGGILVFLALSTQAWPMALNLGL